MITIMRRFMMRIASIVAKQNECKALITGESLGQVASQTVESMTSTEDCASLPIFRPLVAFDKEETMNLARKIGTYETSIEPFEDCCTIFVVCMTFAWTFQLKERSMLIVLRYLATGQSKC